MNGAGLLAGGGRKGILIGAGVLGACLLAGLGFAVLHLAGPRSTALSSFPESVSTDDLRADDIVAFMTGMTIKGIRRDGRPFTIVLNADRTVSYSLARPAGEVGVMARFTGEWRAEDHRFCLRIPRFARGQERCPRIVKEGQKVTAVRRDGMVLPWSLAK